MNSVSIIIATHGPEEWSKLAHKRAYRSAINQNAHQLIIHHDPNGKLHETRNRAAAKATGEWLCFLDGDDELEPGYIEAMLNSWGDLRYPLVRYVEKDKALPPPTELRKCHLFRRNYMVIGTMLRKELFERVGGFEEFPSWEDWALWIKCWLAGAESRLCSRAIYRSYVNGDGRCVVKNPRQLHDLIVAKYAPIAQQKGLA